MRKIFNTLVDWICNVLDWLIEKDEGLVNLAKHVVAYFRGLKLRKGHDVPFIAKSDALKDAIHNAREVHVGGIFEGTLNEDTDEIENLKEVYGDGLSKDIKDAMKSDPLIVLS